MGRRTLLALLACLPMSSSIGHAQVEKRIAPDGSVVFRPYVIPFSTFASDEARTAFARKAATAHEAIPADNDLVAWRARADAALRPQIAKMRQRYAVVIHPETIDGIYTESIIPAGPVSHPEIVLINLHGGGFWVGARTGGQVESIPIASVLGVRVVAVDYRQGPEYHYPAASDDVITVYRALLKRYPARRIGIFGSSAGGLLTAEVVAAIADRRLPRPGAVAILSSGASGWGGGDSSYTAFLLNGEQPWPDGPRMAVTDVDYFRGVDLKAPLVAPAWHPEVLAGFPPTLIVTGSRDFALSAAIDTHRRLDAAGAKVELAAWDGMAHYFYTDPDLPESRAVYARVSRFFAQNLVTRR